MGQFLGADFKIQLKSSMQVYDEDKNDFFLYFWLIFIIKHSLKMWFPWQQGKVYLSNFGLKHHLYIFGEGHKVSGKDALSFWSYAPKSHKKGDVCENHHQVQIGLNAVYLPSNHVGFLYKTI